MIETLQSMDLLQLELAPTTIEGADNNQCLLKLVYVDTLSYTTYIDVAGINVVGALLARNDAQTAPALVICSGRMTLGNTM